MSWISKRSFVGDGATKTYTFDVPYLATDDIHCYLDGSETAAFTVSGSTVTFTSAPGNGVLVEIRRITDDTNVSTLAFGGTPSTTELNNILRRVQYLVQEASDVLNEETFSLASSGSWDAGSKKIINLADGASATDAVNKGQLDGKQPLDATLTAIAALSTAADKLIYATGVDTFSTADLTAFARTLIATADAAAAQTILGLTPGTNVQSYDATLAALATLVTAADKMIYATGSDTFSTADLTAFARTLLDDVDAATSRSTLGLGSLAVVTPTGTPDGTKFLRDDNTWATPAGAGDVVGPASSTANALAQYNGTTGKLLKDGPALATQADMEARTANKVVTADVQHFHPGAIKAAGLVNQSGVQALTTGYNVSSITDSGVGSTTVNTTTPFSSANFWVVAAVNNFGGGATCSGVIVTNKTTSSFKLTVQNAAGTAFDVTELNFMAGGDF